MNIVTLDNSPIININYSIISSDRVPCACAGGNLNVWEVNEVEKIFKNKAFKRGIKLCRT